MIRVDKKELTLKVKKILLINGVNEKQADVVSDCLVSSDMHGVHTHGVGMLPAYVKKLVGKSFELAGEPIIEKKTGAFAKINANNTIGMYAATKAMELAVEMCKESGTYHVFVRNANTFGPAFYYSDIAAKQGLIGMCFSNSPAAMCALGGKEKILGTNPFSIAIPGVEKGPIILDMATSIVAKSKLNEYRKKGEKIPEGWALDESGNPTTDPLEAIKGSILPMAEHKGYGIAMIIDILAGLLSGAAYLSGVNKFYSDNNECMNVGQCFVAIDPSVIYGEEFCKQVDEYIEQVHNSGDNVRFPGERKLCEAEDGKRYGVLVSEDVIEYINNFMN